MLKHIAIYISNQEHKKPLLSKITSGELIKELLNLKGGIFSEVTLTKLIDEEMCYGHFGVQTKTKNSLKNSSEGERKKALLNHILSQNPDYIVLDNVFDCLDIKYQSEIKNKLIQLSNELVVVRITYRKRDFLSFIKERFVLKDSKLQLLNNVKESNKTSECFIRNIPKSYNKKRKTLTL